MHPLALLAGAGAVGTATYLVVRRSRSTRGIDSATNLTNLPGETQRLLMTPDDLTLTMPDDTKRPAPIGPFQPTQDELKHLRRITHDAIGHGPEWQIGQGLLTLTGTPASLWEAYRGALLKTAAIGIDHGGYPAEMGWDNGQWKWAVGRFIADLVAEPYFNPGLDSAALRAQGRRYLKVKMGSFSQDCSQSHYLPYLSRSMPYRNGFIRSTDRYLRYSHCRRAMQALRESQNIPDDAPMHALKGAIAAAVRWRSQTWPD